MKEPLPLTEETIAAYLDGELDAKQRAEFEKVLQAHPEWRNIVAEQADVIAALRPIRVRAPKSRVWDGYWEQIDSKLHRRTGQALIYFGAMLVLIGASMALVAATNSVVVRAGEILVILGLLVLFIKVLRGRMREVSKDRYRNIRR